METDTALPNKRKREDDRTTSTTNSDEQTTVKKHKKKKTVRFDDVTVYYFARSQGFVSVPSQGTVTLGMVPEHCHVEQYSVADFSRLRRTLHKTILRERKLLPPSSTSTLDSDENEEEPLPVDDYYFVQPIGTRQRRTLLKQAGLVKIDATEKHELALIRRSREVCGCSCTRETGGCQPATCDCYLNGIACQVDRLTFPCPCATMLCKNPLGRLEFNQNRVRNHFFETISRLAAEKEQEELLALLKQEDNHEDTSRTIASLLSSIISQIELEEYEVSSILHTVVSSVTKEPPSIHLPCTIPTNRPTSSSNDHTVPTARFCQTHSPIRRKATTSKLLSTEFS